MTLWIVYFLGLGIGCWVGYLFRENQLKSQLKNDIVKQTIFENSLLVSLILSVIPQNFKGKTISIENVKYRVFFEEGDLKYQKE